MLYKVIKVKSDLIKAILVTGFTIVLFNGAVDGGWTLVVGVRCVEDVDGDGGGRVVDLDGVLGAMDSDSVPWTFSMPGARCPRWTSQCQGPLGACAGLMPASLTRGSTGLARCHPNHSHSSSSSPLSLSRVPSTSRLLDRRCLAGYMGWQRLPSFSSASRPGHLFWSASRTGGSQPG